MSHVAPREYLAAIDRELFEIKVNLAFAKRHHGADLVPHYEGEILGLEIAKSIIKRTYYAYQIQEPLHETRTEGKAGLRGREVLSLDEPEKGARGATGKWQKSSLEVLRSLIKDHEENMERAGRSASEARVTATEWKEAAVDKGPVPYPRFYEARNMLIESGIVSKDGCYVSLS